MTAKLDNALGLYLEGIRDGKAREALDRYVGDHYTQHSTGVADGKEGFLEFFEPFLERHPQRDIRVVRAFEDGPYVFAHVHQVLDGGATQWVTMDLFLTDDDDRIVEHWDVITPFEGPNPSGHTQADGTTEVRDLDRTEANKAVVRDFIATVLQQGDAAHAPEFISTESYIQHNTQVGDGLDAFASFAAALAAQGKSIVYHDVAKLVGQGNFVATLSRVSLAGQDLAVFDLFRLEDGLIVEHWDAMEPVPTPDVARNSGKF